MIFRACFVILELVLVVRWQADLFGVWSIVGIGVVAALLCRDDDASVFRNLVDLFASRHCFRRWIDGWMESRRVLITFYMCVHESRVMKEEVKESLV